jgi:hypothetical protein
MDHPKCRLCGYKHALSEPHIIPDTVLGVAPKVTKAVTDMAKPVTDDVTPKHCPTCCCARVYPSNAARQKAYRQRKHA